MNIFRIIATRKSVSKKTNNGFDSTGVESAIETEKSKSIKKKVVEAILEAIKKPNSRKKKVVEKQTENLKLKK